jgi:hypothetical protein
MAAVCTDLTTSRFTTLFQPIVLTSNSTHGFFGLHWCSCYMAISSPETSSKGCERDHRLRMRRSCAAEPCPPTQQENQRGHRIVDLLSLQRQAPLPRRLPAVPVLKIDSNIAMKEPQATGWGMWRTFPNAEKKILGILFSRSDCNLTGAAARSASFFSTAIIGR